MEACKLKKYFLKNLIKENRHLNQELQSETCERKLKFPKIKMLSYHEKDRDRTVNFSGISN